MVKRSICWPLACVCVHVCVRVWYIQHHYTNSVYLNTQSPFLLILQPPWASKTKVPTSQDLRRTATFLENMVVPSDKAP